MAAPLFSASCHLGSSLSGLLRGCVSQTDLKGLLKQAGSRPELQSWWVRGRAQESVFKVSDGTGPGGPGPILWGTAVLSTRAAEQMALGLQPSHVNSSQLILFSDHGID